MESRSHQAMERSNQQFSFKILDNEYLCMSSEDMLQHHSFYNMILHGDCTSSTDSIVLKVYEIIPQGKLYSGSQVCTKNICCSKGSIKNEYLIHSI